MAITDNLEEDGLNMVIVTEGAVRLDPGFESIGSVKDDGPSWLGSHGILTLGQGLPVNSNDISTAATVTDSPPKGAIIIVTDLIISVGATAVSVQIQEETSTNIIAGPFYMAANSTLQLTPRDSSWRTLVPGKRIFGKASAASTGTTFDVHYRYANPGDK